MNGVTVGLGRELAVDLAQMLVLMTARELHRRHAQSAIVSVSRNVPGLFVGGSCLRGAEAVHATAENRQKDRAGDCAC